MNQYISLKKILKTKFDRKKAILAFNAQSIQQIEIAANLSEELGKEIIIQFSQKYIEYFEMLFGLKAIIHKYKIYKHLYFHLDHCDNVNLISKCINWGFDSVMFDGSDLSIDENISKMNQVTSLAHKNGVLVEGEVGVIGGVEDEIIKDEGTIFDLNEAVVFKNNTQVDMLALGIGNAHGVYKSTENVNVNLLSLFQNQLKNKAYLVLHGATGLNDQTIFNAIEYGVVKVNYSTEFKILYQSVINKFIGNIIHDEINFFNLLKTTLEPSIKNIINKLDRCI